MNILFLSESFYPHGSGGELATNFYARSLVKSGFNVAVVTNRFQGEAEKSETNNLTVYRLLLFKGNSVNQYSTLSKSYLLYSSLMSRLMKWADAVYIPGFWYSAIPVAKTHGKPVIVHLHGYFPICPLATLYDMYKDRVCSDKPRFCSLKCIYIHEKKQGRFIGKNLASVVLAPTVGRYSGRLIGLANAVICVSKAQRNMIVTFAPSLRKKTQVIYNPISGPSQGETNGNDFGYFGGPSYLKGFDVLCRAMTYLSRSVRVHATGFPIDRRTTSKPSNGLSIMLYNRLNEKELAHFYKQIRGVLVPSVCPEPSPYVVAEAMLRGRIIIASRIGGIPEQVEGCKGAFMIEPGNHMELAESLQRVGSLSKETAADLGVKNREAFVSHFNNERTMRDFVRVCEGVV